MVLMQMLLYLLLGFLAGLYLLMVREGQKGRENLLLLAVLYLLMDQEGR
jgi:hypothetical protein